MIKRFTLLIALVFVSGYCFSQTVLNETFDNATGFTTSEDFFADTFGDYFGISDGAGGGDFGLGSSPSGIKSYTGMTGNYLTGMDMDGEGATLPITITWSGLDITSLTSLGFSADFAESFESPGDIDAGDFIRIEVQIDGGGFTNILEFRGNGDGTNDFFAVDTNLDGTGDGAVLGATASNISAAIAGTGASLDLRISVSVNSGDEDFALDNVRVESSVAAATQVNLASTSATASETDGSISIEVEIDNESASTATTADLVLTGGSAADLGNYTTQTVTFPANTTANQSVTVNITNNALLEGNKEFTFELQNVGGGSSAEIVSPSEFTLSLTDDERASLTNTVDPTTCDLFTIQDVTLNDNSDTWSCTDGTYTANGFCNGCTDSETETWLVSAGYNFSGATLVGFEYSTASGFDDNSNLPELRVSTDYAGDVSTATWSTITTIDNDDGDDVFIDLTSELAGESFGVVAVRYVTVAPGNAAEAATLSDVELLGNGITLLADPEPTNQPTAFATDRVEFDVISLSWTEAVAGAQAPAGYLVLGSTGTVSDPVDGTSPAEDLSTDGSLAVLIPFGTTEYTFTGFEGGDSYNFAIYSYTNAGDAIDFNITSAPSLTAVTTPGEIFNGDFEGLSNLYNVPQVSVHDLDASDSWYYDSFSGDNFAEMSSSSDGDVEEDWLILGPFNFDAYTGETFSFVSSLGFDANGTPVSVKRSTDFAGNVDDATWTDISVTLSPGSFNDTYSGLIDVSSVSGQVYFAFVYEEDEAAMAEVNGTVQIDDIKVSGSPSASSVTSVASANAGTNLSLASSTTTTGNLTVNNLVLGDIDDVDLTIASGNTLTIFRDLRIEDGSRLIIQDGASLITNGNFSIDGEVIVERTTTFGDTEGGYSTVGSVIQDQSTSTLGNFIYKYDESVAFGADGLARFVEVTTPEVMGGGIGYFSANIGDMSVGGANAIPNNGGYVLPVTFSGNSASAANDGFNLVANPYPAAIDYLNFLDINGEIDGTIYIWDDGGSQAGRRTNTDYITVNDIGTASAGSSRASDWDGSIRSGQGFFIRTDASRDLVFTNDMRVSGNNDSGGFFRQENNETPDKVSLSISNQDFMSTTLIGFRADATAGKDRRYDGYKYAGNTDLQIYSMIESAPYAIQGLPTLPGEDITVGLGFSAAESGIYTINADQIVLPAGYTLVLTDKLLDLEINLSDLGSYTFTTQSETGNSDRFNISFRTSVISSVKDIVNDKLLVFNDHQNVNITLENGSVIDQFTVYTLSGQELVSGINAEQKIQVNKNLFANGVNIIKAKSGNATYTLKFILK